MKPWQDVVIAALDEALETGEMVVVKASTAPMLQALEDQLFDASEKYDPHTLVFSGHDVDGDPWCVKVTKGY